MRKIQLKKIEYIHESDEKRNDDLYVDIVIHLVDGRRFTSTIVTPHFIAKWMENEKQENVNSLGDYYLNDSDMLILRENSKETIVRAVTHLVNTEQNISQFLEITIE